MKNSFARSFSANKRNKDVQIYTYMHFLLFSIFASFIVSSRITSVDRKRFCSDCKFFIPNKMKCAKFRETDIVTGKTDYEFAANVRFNESECGKQGVYFEKNRAKLLTTSYHLLSEYLEILRESYNCSIDLFRILNGHKIE